MNITLKQFDLLVNTVDIPIVKTKRKGSPRSTVNPKRRVLLPKNFEKENAPNVVASEVFKHLGRLHEGLASDEFMFNLEDKYIDYERRYFYTDLGEIDTKAVQELSISTYITDKYELKELNPNLPTYETFGMPERGTSVEDYYHPILEWIKDNPQPPMMGGDDGEPDEGDGEGESQMPMQGFIDFTNSENEQSQSKGEGQSDEEDEGSQLSENGEEGDEQSNDCGSDSEGDGEQSEEGDDESQSSENGDEEGDSKDEEGEDDSSEEENGDSSTNEEEDDSEGEDEEQSPSDYLEDLFQDKLVIKLPEGEVRKIQSSVPGLRDSNIISAGYGNSRQTLSIEDEESLITIFTRFLATLMQRRREFKADPLKHYNRHSRGDSSLMYSSVSKKVKSGRVKLGILIDVSGSMPTHIVKMAVMSLKPLMSVLDPDSTVMLWDTSEVGRFKLRKFPDTIKEGGGTDLFGGVTRLRELGMKQIVVFSDFCTMSEERFYKECDDCTSMVHFFPTNFQSLEHDSKKFDRERVQLLSSTFSALKGELSPDSVGRVESFLKTFF